MDKPTRDCPSCPTCGDACQIDHSPAAQAQAKRIPIVNTTDHGHLKPKPGGGFTPHTWPAAKAAPKEIDAARANDAFLRDLEHLLNQHFAEAVGGGTREPRYRYYEHRGWLFRWTTERMGDGKYAAVMYKPIGKGSHEGKPKRWRLVKELHFNKRSTAKARAYQWYQALKRKDEKRNARAPVAADSLGAPCPPA